MVTKGELDAYRQAEATLDSYVERDIRLLVASLRGATFDEIRDTLTEVMPVLVDNYGQASAALAAELFEDLIDSAARVPVLGEPERVAASVRGTLGPLYKRNDMVTAQTLLVGSMKRHVRGYGRETIHSSTRGRPGVAYARVLGHGGKTGPCSFCVMLASRGPVYGSESNALWADGITGTEYHDDCTCVAVPARGEWIPDRTSPRGARWDGDSVGADFEDLYTKYYKTAWRKNASAREVATLMRAQHGLA